MTVSSDSPTRSCQGCGGPLPPGSRPQRKWCSDICRKHACYSGSCRDCGAPTRGDRKGASAERCGRCVSARRTELSRRWIIASLHEWTERFGSPPTAMDWNQSMARAQGKEAIVERYEQTGRPWPSSGQAQKIFGSWSNALAVAGLRPMKSGERRDPAAWRATRSAAAVGRYEPIAAMWGEGATVPEIAEALEVSPATITNTVAAMRKAGWDLPSRRRPSRLRRLEAALALVPDELRESVMAQVNAKWPPP